jgi:hypothetical protein
LDVIVAQNLVQGFTLQDQSRLAHRFWHWLQPGGVCLVETAMGRNPDFCDQLSRAFVEAGFILHQPRMNLTIYWDAKADNRQWADWWPEFARQASEEEADLIRRLDRGERMVYFSHSMP